MRRYQCGPGRNQHCTLVVALAGATDDTQQGRLGDTCQECAPNEKATTHYQRSTLTTRSLIIANGILSGEGAITLHHTPSTSVPPNSYRNNDEIPRNNEALDSLVYQWHVCSTVLATRDSWPTARYTHVQSQLTTDTYSRRGPQTSQKAQKRFNIRHEDHQLQGARLITRTCNFRTRKIHRARDQLTPCTNRLSARRSENTAVR